ncbi:MAG TPA: hypothetical protein VMJ75_21535 [Candidatus Acidoferrales bacterium]|nr:hypothetical protein [Candidatus Acidoferrales bacterium]
MRLVSRVVIAALVSCGIAGPLLAHGCCHHDDERGCPGCVHCGASGCRTSPLAGASTPSDWAASLKTMDGKVVEVLYLPGATPDTAMVDIRVQAGAVARLVRLAPSGFLRQGGLRLQEGDAVSISAFPVAGMNGDVLVAAEVRAKGVNLRLRGPAGQPLW